MKKIFLITFVSALLFSCTETDQPEQDSLLDGEKTETAEAEDEAEKESVQAISLYSTWLKGELKKDAKANKKVLFGSVLTIVDTASLDGKHYTQVKAVDGTAGWIKTYLIATDAKRDITTKEVSLYKEADILALSDTKIPLGTMVAVENEEVAGYLYVIGAERKVKGYIKDKKSVSNSDLNLEVGMLRQKALALDGQKKLDAIQAIIDNEDYLGSAFYGALKSMLPNQDVEEALEDVKDEDVIDEVLEGLEEEF